jgi:hypothetical protein
VRVPQDKESGREAAAWGREIAPKIALAIGARLLGRNSNECEYVGRRSVIKSARRATDSVGVTYGMLKRLDTVIAVFERRDSTFEVFEIPASHFQTLMRDSAGSGRGKVGLVRRDEFAAIVRPFRVLQPCELGESLPKDGPPSQRA